jgi:hypothetical protein
MKKNNKSWVRQLSESYIRQAINEQFEQHHDELRKTGKTSFPAVSPAATHFEEKHGIHPGMHGQNAVDHEEHGPVTIEQIGDTIHVSKRTMESSPRSSPSMPTADPRDPKTGRLMQ